MWRLSTRELLSFALGTVLLDLTAACWFTYLLIYLEDTLYFDPGSSGYILLTGQVADAIATPLVGYWSDLSKHRVVCGCWHLDRRTQWHFIGTCFVLGFYTMVWTVNCCSGGSNHGWNLIYYAVGGAMFNFGWAAVQVSHLALTGDLSFDEHCRTRIGSARHAFSITSSIIVFLSYLVLVETVEPRGEKTQEKFRYLALIVIAVGFVCSAIFYNAMHHITLKREALKSDYTLLLEQESSIEQFEEKAETTDECTDLGDSDNLLSEELIEKPNEEAELASLSELEILSSITVNHWKEWLSVPEFYVVGLIYMLSRSAINITMVYMCFYLVKTLEMNDTSLALVPLTMYLSSFSTTFYITRWNKKFGRYNSFMFGACTVICSSILCAFVGKSFLPYAEYVYGVASMFGIGTAVILVGSLSIIADLVGLNLQYGAFVYGSHSFADKLCAGVLVIAIQLHRDDVCINENDEPDTEECQDYVRIIMSTVPSVCAGTAICCIYLLMRLYKRRGEVERIQAAS